MHPRESVYQKSSHLKHFWGSLSGFRRKRGTKIATRKMQKKCRFSPENRPNFEIFQNLLEFDKTHRNTSMVQISTSLDVFLAVYGHFQAKICPILYMIQCKLRVKFESHFREKILADWIFATEKSDIPFPMQNCL